MGCHRDQFYKYFFKYIFNDLDGGNNSDISKFADDTKISRIIRSDSHVITLQTNLDRMNEWIDKWEMQFSIKKSKVLSVGRRKPHIRYTIKNQVLISSKNVLQFLPAKYEEYIS